MDCGQKYPPYVMDFDHRDPKLKISTLNRMIYLHRYAKEKLLVEIKKCDVVCANCHRIRTHEKSIKS